MLKNPNFSITICCYNSEEYISETIDSIIAQTYNNWEIIIIDDGSNDKTKSIIEGYKSEGIPIVYFYQENKGLTSARNKSIELSNNDWIAIIDHDDICMHDRLEKQAKDIINNPNCNLFFGNSIHFTEKNKFVREQFDFINPLNFDMQSRSITNMLIKHGNFIDMETVVYNKFAALDIGGFNNKYKYITDYDFLIKMSENYNFFCNADILSKYRIHKNQMTQTMESRSIDEHINFFYINLFNKNLYVYLRLELLFKLIKLYKIKFTS